MGCCRISHTLWHKSTIKSLLKPFSISLTSNREINQDNKSMNEHKLRFCSSLIIHHRLNEVFLCGLCEDFGGQDSRM